VGSNIFISPISLQVTLGMLSQGADGATLDEIYQFIGLREATDSKRLQYFQDVLRNLNVSTPNTTLKLANAIWMRHPNLPKPEFATLAKNVFQSEINTFSDKTQAVKDINHWCDKITQHKIQTIIENIDSNDVMLLLNALYFKSKWKHEFENWHTSPQPFYVADQSVDTVAMMHQTEEFKYAENDSVQILEMPYTNPRFSMIILLPKKGFSSFLNTVNNKNWSKWLGNFNTVKVNLILPKFKIEFAAQLNAPLQHLQMITPFDSVKANFSKLCYMQVSMYISKIFQKTFIEVNESGTVAAAVTHEELTKKLIEIIDDSEKIYTFNANHPFVFAIQDKKTQGILFMGKIMKIK
jgi:serpin B